jgi:hypothetical protein
MRVTTRKFWLSKKEIRHRALRLLHLDLDDAVIAKAPFAIVMMSLQAGLLSCGDSSLADGCNDFIKE